MPAYSFSVAKISHSDLQFSSDYLGTKVLEQSKEKMTRTNAFRKNAL
jgi:hypothetical protein